MSAILSKYAPADSYLKLVRIFPLRPIRTDAEYKAAVAVMERLAIRGEGDLDSGERDYLDGLDQFISAFDHVALANRARRGPLARRLRSLMDDSGTTPRDMEKILRCGHSLVSLLLAGKRELSKENIKALSRHFKLGADYFF